MNIVKKIRIIPRPISPIYNHKNINLYKLHNDKSYIGVDEAGRGPLLGRVYVAAVYYEKPIRVPTDIIIADSKILKPKEIALAADFIMSTATKYSVKYKTEQEIDKYNIYKATMQGMKEAINDIYKTEDKVETVLIDGDKWPIEYSNENLNYYTVIQGDSKYFNIACASILAKHFRDKYINDLCDMNPELDKYNIRSNKGYGAKVHMDALKTYGPSKFHRMSYKPCAANVKINDYE